MARRVFLHVGTPKTGTTFLQDLLWRNRAKVRAQGLLLPGTREQHWRASMYVRDAHHRNPRPRACALDWERLVDATRAASGDVLITHELFAPATAPQARRAIEALGGEETHVVVTARDLVRQIPAGWQQGVKHGATAGFDDFVHDVVHRGPRARVFWRMQDLLALTERWGGSLPADHVHLVTVPRPGAEPSLLWQRFASVVDVDPASVDATNLRRNESLGRVEAELLRRLNQRRGSRPELQDEMSFKAILGDGILAGRHGKQPFGIDPDTHAWAVKAGGETAAALKRRGYHVVGDLDDLVPPDRPDADRYRPEPGAEELLDAANDTILELLELYGRASRRLELPQRVLHRAAHVLGSLSGPRARARLLSARDHGQPDGRSHPRRR